MKSFRDAHQQRGTMSESKFSQFTNCLIHVDSTCPLQTGSHELIIVC